MSLPLPLPPFLVVTLFICTLFPCYLCLPDNDSASTTTLQTLKPILPIPGPGSSHQAAATIPAFPEQSDVKGCPLTLSDELFDGIKSACGSTKHGVSDMELHRTRCCPVLAAWLYSAYSATALSYSHSNTTPSSSSSSSSSSLSSSLSLSSSSYDMPLLPDDSETCVNDLEEALKVRGIELSRPNETCDVVFCFCGIRLHPLSCPDAFSVTQSGELVGDASVRRLERNCISSSNNVDGFPGLGGCSKCLNSLYLVSFPLLFFLKKKKSFFSSIFCFGVV